MEAINKLQRRRGSKGIGVFFSVSAGILLWLIILMTNIDFINRNTKLIL